MQELADDQSSPEVPINENFESLNAAAIYGKAHATTTGLTWGYYGGRWGGTLIADGTVALTNNATNYVVVNRSTGAVSVSTATTNWNNAGAYGRAHKLTTSGGAVATWEDHRAGPTGTLWGAQTTFNLSDLLDVITEGSPSPVDGDALVYRGGYWGAETKDAANTKHIELQLSCSDLINALTIATGVAYARAPRPFTITGTRGSLQVVSSSGLVTVNIKKNGTTIFSTKLTIDANEKTSVTAATAAVLSTTTVADDDELTVDIDGAGTGAKGLIVTILGTRT